MSPPSPRIVNPLDSHIGYHIRRLSSKLMADLATRLRTLGLRPVEATILMLIESNPLITQAKLGVTLGVQRANMVPLMGRLEGRNLIYREALDGKSQGFRLTPEGEELCALATVELQAHDASFFGGLTDNQRKELREKLDSLPRQAGDAPTRAGKSNAKS